MAVLNAFVRNGFGCGNNWRTRRELPDLDGHPSCPQNTKRPETKTSPDVTKFDEDVKGVAESERFAKANTGHPEDVTEDCTINVVDQDKNMTTSSDNKIVNDNVHYVNIDEIMTDEASSNTHDVLSENIKQKTLQEHVIHSDDETKDKKKEKKLHFFAFGKNKTKHKNKQLKCEQTKEESMTWQAVLSEKDSSKPKEEEIYASSSMMLVSNTDSEDRKIQGPPPPPLFADFSMQDGSFYSEAIKNRVVFMDSVSSNSVTVSKDPDDISKVNAISGVMKHDEAVRSGIPSDYGSPSSEPPTSQSDKQNITRNGKDFVLQMKANITDKKKKRWSFNFYDSRKKPQNLDAGIILTNTTGKESEKKHGAFRRFGIRALSQPKSNDEDSRTSSLLEDEKAHNKASKKSPSALKSLKLKDIKNNEKMNRRKSTTDVPIDYEESRSILTTVAESKETDRRRRSLITDDELRIEESDAFEGVSLSSLEENDAIHKEDSQPLPHETVSQKDNIQRNVSYQEEPAKTEAFADVTAQQMLDATVEAVNTPAEQSVKPAIPQIPAHLYVDCLKDTVIPLSSTLQSLKCTTDRAISTGIIPKPLEFALVQQTVKSSNDIIDAANTRIPFVCFEHDNVVKLEESGNSIQSIQRVDMCIPPASESIEVGNDAVIYTVSAHKPVTLANDAVINSSKAETYSAGTRDTAIPTNTAKQSSDLEKESVFVKLNAKDSSSFTKKTAHPAFSNRQTLLVKATDSDSFSDGISRKGNISSVAPTGLAKKKEHTANVSSGQINYNERGCVAQGIPIPCIHEAVQSFLLRRERIALEREEKLHLKSTEHEKMCLTSIQQTQDKQMWCPENVLNEKQNHKGKVKHTNANIKNQIPYEAGGNEGSQSDTVFNIVSTRLSEIEDIQDIAPDVANKLLCDLKRSSVLSLPITNNTSFRQGKVQICKDVGVQAPDVYLPLDDVFGFRSVPAENCRHVGVQFPETVETCTTDQINNNSQPPPLSPPPPPPPPPTTTTKTP
ncbi:hypothetical protein ACJMK2_028381 [Sinanodonta woodiana]|uniref:Uncharacterized protein n=1 Tax=Sinanodonta woodiana TaxID=1069815 RepID=A0ABD3X8G0_SINWO